MISRRRLGAMTLCRLLLPGLLFAADPADLILHNGRVVTVSAEFEVAEAIAVHNGRILRVGSNSSILETKGADTKTIDLEGKMVLPGLIDSHTHPSMASMFEFDHAVPAMESVSDVLDYIRSRAEVVPKGDWIWVSQVFITRLIEPRYPTRQELDEAAPKHAVVFQTGPDASVNSLALQLSGIDREFQVVGSGQIEKDPGTGEPTGILRGGTSRYLKRPPEKQPGAAERRRRMLALIDDYNSVGLTCIADRLADPSAIDLYRQLHARGELTVRVAASHGIAYSQDVSETQEQIRRVARHPLRQGDAMLRVVGIKMFQDGGMLTGSAYMHEPWGVSKIYSITDPDYRGVLFIPKEDLLPIVRTTVESGLQYTAHSVGDAAVDNLIDVYEQIGKTLPLRDTRPCITHCNFMSRESVRRMARLGIAADMQPAWLYLDTRTLTNQFGYERLRYFQPLRSIFEAGGIVGGGSDHMQKIGSLRSTNPYNPFLGMWITITRRAKWHEGQLHPQEQLSREQAIRLYTVNNAYLVFLDPQIGSLEVGKLADLIVIDRDLLNCPVNEIKDTQVLQTYLEGKRIY